MKNLNKKDWELFFRSGKHCLPIKPYEKDFLDHLPHGSKVVDFGCGDGSLGVEVCRRGLRYVGVDYSPSALEQALVRLKKYPRASLLCRNLNKIKLEKEMVGASAVFFRSVLPHIKNKNLILSVAKEALKHRGKIFVLSPICPINVKVNKKLEQISLKGGELEKLCKRIGLAVKKIVEERFPHQKISLVAYICEKGK
jgi:SAM-dependent methyltransferase